MNCFRHVRALIFATSAILMALVIGCIWLGWTGNISNYVVSVLFLGFLSLPCLFGLNLFFILHKRVEMVALSVMSALIIIVLFGFVPISMKWSEYTQRKWFIQNGIYLYQPIVDRVMQNKSKLTGWDDRIDNLAGYKNVYGYTNADGAVTIRFIGRGNWSRAGYLYYSGNKMTAKPRCQNCFYIQSNNAYTNYYFTHLTNGWYEY